MASEELVNRLRERATTLWQWAGRAERTTGPSATTEQWRIDGDLHDDAATEIDRLARELEEARELIRDLVDDEYAGLVWRGKRVMCAYCGDGLYSVSHDGDCPIVRARLALAKDTEGGA